MNANTNHHPEEKSLIAEIETQRTINKRMRKAAEVQQQANESLRDELAKLRQLAYAGDTRTLVARLLRGPS